MSKLKMTLAMISRISAYAKLNNSQPPGLERVKCDGHLLPADAISRTCVEGLKCIAVVTCVLFVPKEAFRMVIERVAKVLFVVVHCPLMYSHNSLSH